MRFPHFLAVPSFAVFAALLLALVPGNALAQGSQITVTQGEAPRSMDRSAVRIEQRLGEQVPLTAQFKDHTGAARTFGSLLEGKPSIVLPIFYNCTGVCNMELRGTLDTLKLMKSRKLGKDFDVIIVGIHPKETPDLAEGKYKATVAELEQPGTEAGWKFLIGDMPNIRKVTDALGFHYTYDEGKDTIEHPSGIMFLTPQGKISSYIYGATYTVEGFEKNLALAEKSKVGEKATELFFGCVNVDPVTGKRSLVIRNVLKLMGIATLGIMGFSFLVLTGRARLKRR